MSFRSSVIVPYYNNKLLSFFDVKDNLCYCKDVSGLKIKLGYEHDSDEWILFIDSSKTSLKAVLLYNGSVKPSISIAHTVNMTETYEAIKLAWRLSITLNITGRFAQI